jgi:ribosomal protein S7
MATLQKQITEKFLVKLKESGEIHGDTVEQLQELMSNGKKLKADEIIKVFQQPGGDVK